MQPESGEAKGILYLVATPIGNLQDMTQRAKQVLAEADLIAAEDTRRTRSLLSHLGIDRPLESYHQHAERIKAARLLARIAKGGSVALVSDAGVPVISDPGAHLVAEAWEMGVRVCPIPGPSAVLTALCASGFSADRFSFAGYPPRKAGERSAFYRALATSEVPAVIYEAPHRIRDSLDDAIAQIGGDRLALIGREMTKQFEEFRRGPLSELRPHYDEVEPLGEYTIVFAPAPGGAESSPLPSDAGVERAAHLLVSAGVHTGDAADILAAATGMSRKDAYAMILNARPDANRSP